MNLTDFAVTACVKEGSFTYRMSLKKQGVTRAALDKEENRDKTFFELSHYLFLGFTAAEIDEIRISDLGLQLTQI